MIFSRFQDIVTEQLKRGRTRIIVPVITSYSIHYTKLYENCHDTRLELRLNVCRAAHAYYVITSYSIHYTKLYEQDAAAKTVADHKITVGVSDGTDIEVIEGLEAGDTVTVPIENQNEGVTGMGFGGGMRQAQPPQE